MRLDTLTSLEKLMIISNPRFWPTDLSSLTSLDIGCFDNDEEPLDYFPWHDSKSGSWTSSFVSLTSLELIGWRNLKSLPEPIQYISALRNLTIKHFHGLEALPEWLGKIPCLKILELLYCSNLKQLPNLTNLQQLSIWYCPLLEQRCAKDIGAEWHKIAHIPYIKIQVDCSIDQPRDFNSALRDLTLPEWPNLTIENFDGLETLPEWLGSIPCLQRLKLLDCSNLKQLPYAEAMLRITNLQQLRIRQCPLLVQRRTKDSGAEWHKIAHISETDT
ncbi:hypothetical protein ACH5RR_040350 [Cinchona calisaya]|uniref:R13L1/DRL21-like LRR repeat region domain-containing protein n=1 Tax=Cinchona calisaya TaxID=153742 RepID=A0ABD2XSK9_9GENT